MSPHLAVWLEAAAAAIVIALSVRYARRHPRIPEEGGEDVEVIDPELEHGHLPGVVRPPGPY